MHASNNCKAHLGLVDHVQNRTEQQLRTQLYKVRSFVLRERHDVGRCRTVPYYTGFRDASSEASREAYKK